MLIAGHEMYELLQAQERACAKSCFGASWKWFSVSMSLESGWEFRVARSLPLIADDKPALKWSPDRDVVPFT
jgi:hypothetical protein